MPRDRRAARAYSMPIRESPCRRAGGRGGTRDTLGCVRAAREAVTATDRLVSRNLRHSSLPDRVGLPVSSCRSDVSPVSCFVGFVVLSVSPCAAFSVRRAARLSYRSRERLVL